MSVAWKEKGDNWFIKGNREEYLLNHKNGAKDGWISPSSSGGGLLYTYENLTQQDFEFFENLEISGRMHMDGYADFLYCHGSMEEARGNLKFGSENAKETLNRISESMILCGHTHRQGVYEYHGKKIVNVGSVGLPFDHDGKAQFGILTGNKNDWELELLQLEYNRQQAITEIYESKLFERSGIYSRLVEETLLTGIDRSSQCFHKVLELYKERTGSNDECHLHEEDWERAAEELGIATLNRSSRCSVKLPMIKAIFFDLFYTLINPRYSNHTEYDVVGMTATEWEKYAEYDVLYKERALGMVGQRNYLERKMQE